MILPFDSAPSSAFTQCNTCIGPLSAKSKLSLQLVGTRCLNPDLCLPDSNVASGVIDVSPSSCALWLSVKVDVSLPPSLGRALQICSGETHAVSLTMCSQLQCCLENQLGFDGSLMEMIQSPLPSGLLGARRGHLARLAVLKSVCSVKQLAGLNTALNKGIRTRHPKICSPEM